MKQTKIAFIIALGLVVPGLASAANFTGNGNIAYERDLTVWNGSDHDAHAARLAVQKQQFEYNSIYENDSAWNGFGQGANAARLTAQEPYFEYNKIYEHDLTAWNDTGRGSNPLRLAS